MQGLLDRPYMKGRVNYGLTFDPRNQTHWEDTGINTNEEVASGEVAIDVTPDATSAIPVGTTIRIDSEPMSVTATGTTLTVVRKHTVTHSTATDIYKLVKSCVLWLPGQDDPQSAVIRDRSGFGNDGAITGATWARNDLGLWVLSFDGNDDYIDCGAIGNAATHFWVSIWIWFPSTWTGTGENKYIFGKYVGAEDYLRLMLHTSGTLYWQHLSGDDLKFNLAASNGGGTITSWTGETWYHVLASMEDDGSDSMDAKIIINDGTVVAGEDAGQTAAPNGGNVIFGDWQTSQTTGLVGRLALEEIGTGAIASTKKSYLFHRDRYLFGV